MGASPGICSSALDEDELSDTPGEGQQREKINHPVRDFLTTDDISHMIQTQSN